MSTLWLKFPDDASLPASFTPAEQEAFNDIYDATNENSVWRRAAALLGLAARETPMVRWHKGLPYINWTQLVHMVSCGWIGVGQAAGGGYAYQAINNLLKLPALLRSQWKTERYITSSTTAPLPATRDDRLVESTALGLALQAILLRLPAHTPQDLANWLATPAAAPVTVRKTVGQVQAIQKRRTQLSPAWAEVFPHRVETTHPQQAPEFFWDEPPADAPAPEAVVPDTAITQWQGLPVCAGSVTGAAIYLRSATASLSVLDPAEFPILVFPRARPETVEVFEHASGLLFAEGGALSHACTVAREQGIPCVTGLGPDFLATIEARLKHGKVWLTLDGATGTVKLILPN